MDFLDMCSFFLIMLIIGLVLTYRIKFKNKIIMFICGSTLIFGYGWLFINSVPQRSTNIIAKIIENPIYYQYKEEKNSNTQDKDGNTVVMEAAKNGDIKVLKEVMQSITDVNIKNKLGLTALHYAVRYDDKEIVEYLITKGANVNAVDNNKVTPLMLAASNGDKEIVEYLVEKGANVNAIDNNKVTPLMLAASNGNKYIVQVLLNNGADINLLDNKGNSVFKHAAFLKNKNIVNVLGAYSIQGTSKAILNNLYEEIIEILHTAKAKEQKEGRKNIVKTELITQIDMSTYYLLNYTVR